MSASHPIAHRTKVTASGGGRFAVRRLALTDFRCYAALRLDLDGRSVVLTGANGAGKTNLLEALSYLAPGRGLRGARLAEADRLGAGPWAVAATMATPDGERQIGTGPDPDARQAAGFSEADGGREKRTVRLDGQTAKGPTALSEVTSVLWLTPAMDRLFVESAGARRRFLDRLVFGVDPAHAGRIAAYERAMRERSRLLRDTHRRDSQGRGADTAWLAALEQTMAERAVAIAAARRDTVAQLNAAATEGLGPFPTAELALAGTPEAWLDAAPALACEERLMAVLAAARAADAESGGASVGPHRSDLVVHHAARRMPAHLCSTGEQKALVVGIVMANARLQGRLRGAAPLLLMDEVAAHFDEAHRRALFAEIGALGVQAWLSGTDAALFAPLGEQAQFFRVAAATVAPMGAPSGVPRAP